MGALNFLAGRIVWIFKQILPLTYHSILSEENDTVILIWKMWFGHSYKIRKFHVIEK